MPLTTPHATSCRIVTFRFTLDGQQHPSTIPLLITKNRELAIAHQDLLLDRLHAFLQQGGIPEVVVAGEQQCGLHKDWREFITSPRVQEKDAVKLATDRISTIAIFLPPGLVQEAVPQLATVKEEFKECGGRCGA
jgi:hypothetical protein